MASQLWTDKRILITGICGTVGTRIFEQLSKRDPEEIVGIENNEGELFFLEGLTGSCKLLKAVLRH